MKDTNQYIIPINGLSEGSHSYTFFVDDLFFSYIENTDISKGNVDVSVVLNKTGKVITLELKLEGSVVLPCDRCLDDMEVDITLTEQLIVEYGEGNQDIAEDNIIFVSENNDIIDLRQYIFEYILLSIPYQRVHEEDEQGLNSCDPEMLEKIEEFSPAEYADENIDPRWNELKKIKNGTS